MSPVLHLGLIYVHMSTVFDIEEITPTRDALLLRF